MSYSNIYKGGLIDGDKKLVLSIAFMPPLEYFCCLARAGEILIEVSENYVRQTWRNRCVISNNNGEQILTVSLRYARKNHVPVRDVRIDYTDNWNVYHWKAIQSAYNSSPFFLYYRDDLEPFFIRKFDFLFDLDFELLSVLLKLCSLSAKLGVTTEFNREYNDANDLRYCIVPPKSTMRQPLFDISPYRQVFSANLGFLPNLSILDLLFNLGPETADYLNNCKLQANIRQDT